MDTSYCGHAGEGISPTILGKRTSRDRDMPPEAKAGIPGHAIKPLAILVAFALGVSGLSASATHAAGDAHHPARRKPAKLLADDVLCAGTAAALAARLPEGSSDELKQKSVSLIAKTRQRAIADGIGLSIGEADIDRRIGLARDEVTAYATRPDKGKDPAEGVINQRIFFPLLSCELKQLHGAAVGK